MNCPVCGRPMERGNLVTKNSIGLFFMPPCAETGLLFDTRRGIERKNGIVLDGPYSFRLNETEVSAYACKGCRKILIDY